MLLFRRMVPLPGPAGIGVSLAKAFRQISSVCEFEDPGGGEAADRVVIGKMEDITKAGALRPRERTLLSQLTEDFGNAEANWVANERVLLKEMASGRPIRDASVDPTAGLLPQTMAS